MPRTPGACLKPPRWRCPRHRAVQTLSPLRNRKGAQSTKKQERLTVQWGLTFEEAGEKEKPFRQRKRDPYDFLLPLPGIFSVSRALPSLRCRFLLRWPPFRALSLSPLLRPSPNVTRLYFLPGAYHYRTFGRLSIILFALCSF